MTVSWTKFIPWEQVDDYRELGWDIKHDALNGTSHSVYSVVGCWRSDNPNAHPPMPVLRSDVEEHKAVPVTPKC